MKLKKIIIISSSILISLLIGLCIYFGVIKNNDETQEQYANMNFTINDYLQGGNGESVKVILLGGQSNATGISYVSELEKNVSSDKFNEYSRGYSNVFINYYNDNGNNVSNGFVNVKVNQGGAHGMFGPELGMGEKLSELYPDEKIFIIKYSWSGSNLYNQWNSQTGQMYKAFIKFSQESLLYLKFKNYNPQIVAMMWMQGESDSLDYCVDEYEGHLLKMIEKIRLDLKSFIDEKGMYFVDAYISNSSFWPNYKKINQSKQNICDSNNLNLCIDTIKEGLTTDKEPYPNIDLAHYDSLSEIKLGHLFIETYHKNS